MSPSEKISLLESLLSRVQARGKTRPERAVTVAPAVETLLASPPSAVPAPTASVTPVVQVVAAPVVATPVAPAPTPMPTEAPKDLRPALTPSHSQGSYVSRGGVADELPELELGDDEDEEIELGYAETVMANDEPVLTTSGTEEQHSEEFAIPSHSSQLLGNAKGAAEPLTVEHSSDAEDLFEIDRRPLASAVPPSPESVVLTAIPPYSTSAPSEAFTTTIEAAAMEAGEVELSASSIAPPADDEPELEQSEELNEEPAPVPLEAAAALASETTVPVNSTEVVEATPEPVSESNSLNNRDVESISLDPMEPTDVFEVVPVGESLSTDVGSAPTLMAALESVVPPPSNADEESSPDLVLDSTPSNESNESIETELVAAPAVELRAEVYTPAPIVDAMVREEQTVIAPTTPLTFMAMLRRSLNAKLKS